MFVIKDNGHIELLGLENSRRTGKRYEFKDIYISSRLTSLFNSIKEIDLIDISISGALIYCKEKLKVNQKIRIDVELDNRFFKRNFVIRGKVIRRKSDGYYAIKFERYVNEIELFAINNQFRVIDRRNDLR